MVANEMMQGMAMDPSMMQGMAMDPSMMQDPAAAAGRGGDTVLAHLTVGEVILPAELVAQFGEELVSLLGEEEFMMRTVGHPSNRINPETGYPEFFFGIGSWFKKQWKSVSGQRAAEKKAAKERARVAAEMKRQAEEMRIFQDKERRKTRESRLASSRAEKKKQEALMSREDKLLRAQALGIDAAGDIAEVAAQRKGEGKLISGKQARVSSAKPSYQKFRNKEMGLQLALRSPRKKRPA